jgi:hypothetical protein
MAALPRTPRIHPRAVILAVLLMLAAAGAMAAFQDPTITVVYYSDATYTHVIGRCIYNPCRHIDSCTGQRSGFFKSFAGLCTP